MERHIPKGMETTVSFIPEEYAKVGNIIKLKDQNGTWKDGCWSIISVGHKTEMPENINKAIREHRKKTGDSLPKQ